METVKRSILLVEDVEDVHTLVQDFVETIPPGYVLLSALTLKQGEDLFRGHAPEIAAILMDGCVDVQGARPDTLDLIRTIRSSGWRGPIISITSLPDLWPAMNKAGCTAYCPKIKIFEQLPALLGS